MKIILSSSVAKLGKIGETKTVANGYARNYLLPQKLAVLYSEGAARGIVNREKTRAVKSAVEAKDAVSLKAKVEKINLEFPVLVDEKGELYGSIGKGQILKSLKSKGLSLPKNTTVELSAPIKVLGESKVSVRLHPEVIAELRVNLVKSEASS